MRFNMEQAQAPQQEKGILSLTMEKARDSIDFILDNSNDLEQRMKQINEKL